MSDPALYLKGHTDREQRWLSLQTAVINPLTDSFLRRPGISAGMLLLELGCGMGEVSLISARLAWTQSATITLTSASFDARAALEAIEQEKATVIGCVTTRFIARLQNLEFLRFDLNYPLHSGGSNPWATCTTA